jgi:integrase
MLAIIDFAIASARRQAEITRLEWIDNDEIGRTGLVRDAKHPRHKEGNHRRFKYTPEAWAIVERQPRGSEYIFPFDAQSIGAAFTRACGILGIQDLHFHDLRHEATSRLFERGYQIHEVAQFTLHDSWNELKRYANLKPEDVRDIIVPTMPGDRHDHRHNAVLVAHRPSLDAGRSARRGRSH